MVQLPSEVPEVPFQPNCCKKIPSPALQDRLQHFLITTIEWMALIALSGAGGISCPSGSVFNDISPPDLDLGSSKGTLGRSL